MSLTYRTFCSGIGAPECAWTPLGWRCLSSCEVDAQASAVLAHHYPHATNLGDMTTCKDAITNERADLFVAGTPCQSFSVAGLRKGMADPRGNLALVFLGLVDAARPRWVVWENVPGVLSSGGGRDFGSFLGALAELGYGFAYRVFDAQYVRVESHVRAVPQRRRRVFVVGHLGDWRRAAAVLLERESLCGHPAPRREAGKDSAGTLDARTSAGGFPGTDGACNGHVVSGTLQHNYADKWGLDNQHVDAGCPNFVVAHALKAAGSDGSEDGTGRGVPICVQQQGSDVGSPEVPCLRAGNAGITGGLPAVAFQECQSGTAEYDTCGTMRANGPGHDPVGTRVRIGSHVRRLTPTECERLQGFPDGYTQVPFKGKPMADAPRYRMLGNSMAVNVMSWIGQRIHQVEELP